CWPGGRSSRRCGKAQAKQLFRPKPILPCRETVVCQTRRRLLERTLLNQALGSRLGLWLLFSAFPNFSLCPSDELSSALDVGCSMPVPIFELGPVGSLYLRRWTDACSWERRSAA